jgi:hypothetical protein
MVAGGLPECVELAAGEELHLALESAAGAGYVWELIPVDGHEVADLAVEAASLPPATEAALPLAMNAPLSMVVAGRRSGEAHWRLQLVRPWAREAPLRSHDLTVIVSG